KTDSQCTATTSQPRVARAAAVNAAMSEDPTETKNKENDLRTENDPSRGPYECDKCKQTYSSKKLLVSHRPCYSGLSCFTCTTCGKVFTRKTTFISHMARHGDDIASSTVVPIRSAAVANSSEDKIQQPTSPLRPFVE